MLHVPNISVNLMSVSERTRHGIPLLLKHGTCIMRKDDEHLANVDRTVNNLYRIPSGIIRSATARVNVAAADMATLWHQPLGHMGDDNMRRVNRASMLSGGQPLSTMASARTNSTLARPSARCRVE